MLPEMRILSGVRGGIGDASLSITHVLLKGGSLMACVCMGNTMQDSATLMVLSYRIEHTQGCCFVCHLLGRVDRIHDFPLVGCHIQSFNLGTILKELQARQRCRH